MNIVLESHTVTPEYKIPYPEWDKDSWANAPDTKTVYGEKTEIWVAAIAGDPPVIGTGHEPIDAVSELLDKRDNR